MSKSKIQLEFNCPKKWSEMIPQGNGRFCDDCKKVITDFSKVSIEKLNTVLEDSSFPNACGSYNAYQLERPFNNWKDKIISIYHKLKLGKASNKFIKSISLFVLLFVLLVTGCHRRRTGYRIKVIADPNKDGITQNK